MTRLILMFIVALAAAGASAQMAPQAPVRILGTVDNPMPLPGVIGSAFGNAVEELEPEDEPKEVIFGGSRAPRALRRHLALVVTVTRAGLILGCTGSVVAKRYILSAAHCFKVGKGRRNRVWAKNSYVLVGEPSTDPFKPDSARNKYYMKQVFILKKYARGGEFAADVAVVELKEDIADNLFFPIALDDAPSKAPRTTFVGGYGVRGTTRGFPNRLQRAVMVYESWKKCLGSVSFRADVREKETVCVTSRGFPNRSNAGMCFGDSGGPVTSKRGKRYVQFGITSFFYGSRCESSETFHVVQRVSFFRKSIDQLIEKNQRKAWNRLK